METRSTDAPPLFGGDGEGVARRDTPMRRPRWAPGAGWEFLGSAASAACLVLVAFQFANARPVNGMVACGVLAFLVIYGVVSRLRHGVRVTKDRLASVFICLGASAALFPLVEIIVSVVANGAPVVFSHFPSFLVHDLTAGPAAPVWKNGMGGAIVGTGEQVGLATLYTVPISLLTAVFLSEASSASSRPLRTFSNVVRMIVDAMMGTPSIIAGLFVYLFWVQPRGANGHSGFAASVALAILMLPIMIRTAEEVIRVVPGSLREAALALGSPRWRVSLRIVLPTVRTGLVTAIILGVALGVGETAPALFTAHGSLHYNWSPFSGPQANLPLEALAGFLSPNKNEVREGWGAAFILITLVLGLFFAARLVGSDTPGARRRHLRIRRAPKEVAP